MKNFSFAVLLSGNGSNLQAMIDAIEGNQDAILAMQRAKKAVSDAEACLATFKKNPTNLAERDAFVQAATAITPAITGLALYSKAAVSAACAELAAATHEWKHKVSARRANGSTAEFEEATTCAEAAEAALAAAHRLQERVMETMSNEDATDAVAADTTIEDELLAAVPVAVEAVAAALSAFDRRDGKVVHEAAERLEAAEASLAALSERSSVTMGSQSPKQRPSSASGTMDSTMEGMKGAGTAVAALRSAQGSRPSMSVEDAIPDNVEEFLDGEEASFIAICDGENVLPLASSQDHKRLQNNDLGPNTGGMGAYSPAPVVNKEIHEKIMNQIILPTMKGMKKDGVKFQGFLYAGVIIDNNCNIKTLEFNCRMGDPETQPILFRLKSNLFNILNVL